MQTGLRPAGKALTFTIASIGLVMGVSVCQARDWIVSTAAELAGTVSTSLPGDTILLEDGVYPLSATGTIAVRTAGLTIRGQSGDRAAVVVHGWGMPAHDHNGFWVAADDVTIADLTIQDVGYHCIQTDVNTDRLTVRNCILRDAGEQILKVPAATGADPSDAGLVEGCLFEYSAGVGPRSYMGGIDVHRGSGWTVRDNLFRDIRSPGGSISEHAVHFWNDSRDTAVERNRIVNCDRGIGFGLGTSNHTGGIIRNNTIVHDGTLLPDGSPGFDDVGIGLESAPGARVVNNTILFSHAYNAIEYRFAATTDVQIANNLANRPIQLRNGASATLAANITNASDDWFVDAQAGDLHLAYRVPDVVDQGIAVDDLADDMDRETRPMGMGIDIGADEYADCRADGDGDGDVDGSDLAGLAAEFTPGCLDDFANRFGMQEI
jgi:hypothetical protein